MKKSTLVTIIAFTTLFLVSQWSGTAFASDEIIVSYQVNEQDQKIVIAITKAVEKLIAKKGESKRSSYISQLSTISEAYKENIRIHMILSEVIKAISPVIEEPAIVPSTNNNEIEEDITETDTDFDANTYYTGPR